MSIRYVKHRDIDFERWDKAIASASNSIIYAESWFLNITANDQWDAIVEGDYEVVMPLPFNRKLVGYHQLYQPFFTQQLGVFSQSSEINVQQFIDHIPKKFRRQYIAFNWRNTGTTHNTRTNLVIDLDKPYSEIEAAFSTSLRKRIRKHRHMTLSEEKDVKTLVEYYRTRLESKVKLGPKGYTLAFNLFGAAMNNGVAKMYSLKEENTVIAIGIFFCKYGRIINVFAASEPSKKHAMSVFLAKVMEANAEKKVLFDFEGSEIPGIQQYFKSFGSVEQNYPILRINRLPFWLKLIRPN